MKSILGNNERMLQNSTIVVEFSGSSARETLAGIVAEATSLVSPVKMLTAEEQACFMLQWLKVVCRFL